MMLKDKVFKFFKSIQYLVLTILTLLSLGVTYPYWGKDILAPNVEGGNHEVQMGEWDFIDVAIITVDNNHGDFSTFTISIEKGESLGTDFSTYFNFSPLAKDHIGVDQTAYTFDDWYLDTGVKFTSNTVVTEDITVYPSWNTSLFTYSKSGSRYNITKPSSVTYSGDLYVPGWRYKGLKIGSINGMSGIEVLSLSIGDGVNSIPYQAFKGANATSLYLGEGLTSIGSGAFEGAKIYGSLKIPSTVVTISSSAFRFVTFDGTLDLTSADSLTSFGERAFEQTKFVGDLYIPANVVTIGPTSFSNTTFDGELDLSDAISLETISSYAFNGAKFVGVLYIPENVGSIGASSFSGVPITTLNLEDANNLTTIGNNAFTNAGIETLIFPSDGKLEFLGTSSFQNTKIAGYLILPPTIKTINGVAFAGAKFTQIFIPISVESIGGSVFSSSNITIKYEGSSIPPGWSANWNFYNHPVLFNQEP